MKRFFSLLTFENIIEAMKKAYKKYEIANSGFWVTSLSFYTIVALVPISAILFSLGSWFGARKYIINQIANSTPLPKEVVDMISVFAENLLKSARGGILAGIGFLFLGWTFLKMFSLIENSFNDIWHIRIPRTFIRKVSDYIAFFIFLPLLFLLLNGSLFFIIGKLENISILSQIVSKMVPYISLLIFLSSLYVVMPNTKINIVPATSAAFVISVIFYIFQIIFINIQIVINNYNVIYGSFSVIFIFLLWIRVFWFFIILGVHLSYLFQNVSFDINMESDKINISFNSKLYLTLKIFEEIVKRYLKSERAVSFEELRENIGTSPFIIDSILDELVKNDYLICGENEDEEKVYSMIKNIDEVTLKEIYLFSARMGEEIHKLNDNLHSKIEEIIETEDYDKTLRSLGEDGGQI